ncbi:MAG: hypothetical protein MJ239_00035 [Bacilli bacterium]|nr:hypothetical protein [Bacilli bacterium]
MKKNKIISVALLSSAMILAACGGNGGNSSQTSGQESAQSGQTSAQSGESEVRKYVVRISATAGVTIVADKTKAAAGETVTLNVTLAEGYNLKSLTAGSETLTVYEGVASFTMPDDDIIVKATVTVSGDVVIAGTVAAPMVKISETLYKATGVEVVNDSYFVIKVGNTMYGWMSLDKYQSFGDIELQYPYDTGTYGKVSPIAVAGNAAYDIVFDLTKANPITIQRSEVLSLPTTAGQVADIFGAMSVHRVINPANVKHVTYTSAKLNKTFEWKRYSDNSSYASVKGLSPLDTSVKHVYRSIKDGVYTTVNNFTQGLQNKDINWMDEAPLKSKVDGKSVAYSAKYEIVDEFSTVADQKNYQIESDKAQYMVDHNLFDLYAIDFDQHEGYRTGFDMEDNPSLKDYGLSIKSTPNADGGFTTSIESYKDYQLSQNINMEMVHYAYSISVTFTKAGAPLNGSFSEIHYDDDAYDFVTKQYKPGYEELGTVINQTVYAYEYGEAYEGAPTFDATPYFASEITPAVIHNKQAVTVVAPGTNLSEELKVTASPSTALDAWQYGFVGCSDPEMVYYNQYSYWQTDYDKEGKFTITVGNHVDTNVTATLELENKVTTYIRQFGFNDPYDKRVTKYEDGYVMAGETYAFKLGTQAYEDPECSAKAIGDKGSLSGITFGYDKEGYIECSVDTKNRKLVVNATGAITKMKDDESSIVIKVTVNSPYYGTDRAPTVLNITVYNVHSKISEEYLPGTWKVEKESAGAPGDVMNFTADVAASGYKTGSITIEDNEVLNTWTFEWNFDGTEVLFHNVKYVSGTTYKDYMFFDITCVIEWQSNKLGLYFVATSVGGSEEGEWSGKEKIILGDYYEDEEGYIEYSYVFFEKNA